MELVMAIWLAQEPNQHAKSMIKTRGQPTPNGMKQACDTKALSLRRYCNAWIALGMPSLEGICAQGNAPYKT